MISKYKLKDSIGELVFRDANRNIITITKDNISDSKVEIAKANGKGNCFIELEAVKKKDSQLNTQLTDSLLTLNEVPTDESDSLPAQPNKRAVSEPTKKKVGRPPKSKE